MTDTVHITVNIYYLCLHNINRFVDKSRGSLVSFRDFFPYMNDKFNILFLSNVLRK